MRSHVLALLGLLGAACSREGASIVGVAEVDPHAQTNLEKPAKPPEGGGILELAATELRDEGQQARQQAKKELSDIRSELERSSFQDRTPAQIAADEALTTQVRFDLSADDKLRDCVFEAATMDGALILRGHVQSAAQKAHALEVAIGVRGVKRVTDRLEIKPRQSTDPR